MVGDIQARHRSQKFSALIIGPDHENAEQRNGSSIPKPKIHADCYQRENSAGKPEAENVADVVASDALSGIICRNRFRSLIFVLYHCRGPLLNVAIREDPPTKRLAATASGLFSGQVSQLGSLNESERLAFC